MSKRLKQMSETNSRLRNQPKYRIGDKVKVKVNTTHSESGTTFENEIIAFISVIRAAGTEQKDTYDYGVTTSMPAAYFNGKTPFVYIMEDNIVLA